MARFARDMCGDQDECGAPVSVAASGVWLCDLNTHHLSPVPALPSAAHLTPARGRTWEPLSICTSTVPTCT